MFIKSDKKFNDYQKTRENLKFFYQFGKITLIFKKGLSIWKKFIHSQIFEKIIDIGKIISMLKKFTNLKTIHQF